MALSKIKRPSLDTGIADNSDATAITINSSENVGIGEAAPTSQLTIGGNANTTAKPTVQITDMTNGASMTLRGQSPKLMFDPTASGVPKVLLDGRGIEFKDGTLDAEGNVDMKLDPSGNVLIGTDSFTVGGGGHQIEPSGIKASSRNTTSAAYHYTFYNPNGLVGNISTNGGTTSYNESSDHRLKENVTDMTGAIARVKQLAPKRFNFIADPDDTTVDGFLAHEAQTVVPQAITGTHNEVDDDGNAVMQGIDQSKLVPLLTGALKEAITKIETLETEMTALKARVTTLENA